MNRLLVICGSTASGKTNIGLDLAKKFNGEIVSADSRQVYQGMDIGTGKDIEGNSKFKIQNSKLKIKNNKLSVGFRFKETIPIWLVDIVKPDYRFNVGEYIFLAKKAISDIWSRNKLPIIVGGTGLYIRALIEPLSNISIPPDKILRNKLEKLSREELSQSLKNLDVDRWRQMNRSDRLNPRRLIRAIELTSAKSQNYLKRESDDQFKINKLLLIGLTMSFDSLYEKIDKRVEERVRKGAVDEIRGLLEERCSFDNSALGVTIGYKEWKPYFEKTQTKKEVIKRWKFAEHAYARRQLTWFKKEKRIYWFDTMEKNYRQKIEETVGKWYTSDNHGKQN